MGRYRRELGNLTNLVNLSLTHGELSGEIPPELGNLTNLTNLYLHDNRLSGVIPPELVDRDYLYELNLARNQLSGRDTARVDQPEPDCIGPKRQPAERSDPTQVGMVAHA